MNATLYYLGSGFTLGVFVGYLLRKNWFVIRSLAGAKKPSPSSSSSSNESQKNEKKPAKVDNPNIEKASSETSSGAPTSINYNDDFKLVLVVRNDLKMGKGKAAAQVNFRLSAIIFESRYYIYAYNLYLNIVFTCNAWLL